MQYDPIKNSFARIVRRNTFFRRVFYKLLGIMFLREWYVKNRIREIYVNFQPENILDAGSGFGQYTYFLARYFRNAKILSVDVKVDQIDDCKYFFNKTGYSNCEFKFGDLTKLDDKNKFDLILSIDVMEHIENDADVFTRFYRALRKNGRVLINTPSNLGGSDSHGDEDESFIGEHVRTGYSRDEICLKLKGAGFEIESFEYTYGKWGSRYWKLGIKYPMLMLNVSKLFFIILPFYYLLMIWFVWLFMKLDIEDKNKNTGTGILVTAIKGEPNPNQV